MPRFVVLKHYCEESHWDFMLEAGAILRTWKLFVQPEFEKEIIAATSFDHRLVYLDYEGPISDNRGSVSRFDSGSFEWITNEKSRIIIRLTGKRLSGIASMLNNAGKEWHLTIKRDNIF